MPKVVPSQIDLSQLRLVLLDACGSRLQRVAVGEELQRFPRGCSVGWNAPLVLPNTYASGPSARRRLRIAASRFFGLKGMRRFSLSFAVVPGMPI